MSARKPTQMHTWEFYVNALYRAYVRRLELQQRNPVPFAAWYKRYEPKSEYAQALFKDFKERNSVWLEPIPRVSPPIVFAVNS